MSTCGEAGSDVHALIVRLAIRRIEHMSEIHSNESQHLAKGTEVARIRLLSFVLQQELSFHAHDIISADRSGAYGHTAAPFVRPGACARALHQGDKPGPRHRESERERE